MTTRATLERFKAGGRKPATAQPRSGWALAGGVAVYSGQRPLSRVEAARFILRVWGHLLRPDLAALTIWEREVVESRVGGESFGDIARRLRVTKQAAHKAEGRALRKLGAPRGRTLAGWQQEQVAEGRAALVEKGKLFPVEGPERGRPRKRKPTPEERAWERLERAADRLLAAAR
jgi:hypothetical protein